MSQARAAVDNRIRFYAFSPEGCVADLNRQLGLLRSELAAAGKELMGCVMFSCAAPGAAANTRAPSREHRLRFQLYDIATSKAKRLAETLDSDDPTAVAAAEEATKAQAAMRADLAMELDEAQWRPPAVAAEGYSLDFSAGSFACFETVDGGKRSWVCV